MVLWTLIAVMTVVAVVAVIVPLVLQSGKKLTPAAAHDVAVYKDQLDEVSRDLDSGLINSAEAEATRAEIARRLLRASEAEEKAQPPKRSRMPWAAAAAAIVLVPVISVALYLAVGSPGIPDQPLSARAPATSPHGGDVARLLEGAEAYLKDNPSDGTAWSLVAPVYLRVNRPSDAVTAFGKAIELLGSNAKLQIGLGESIVAREGGKVVEDAKAAFRRALEHAPDAVEPRFFLAVALNQEGSFKEAAAAWEEFLKTTDPREAWVRFARSELEKAQKGAGLPVKMPEVAAAPQAQPQQPAAEAPAAPGPSADDVAAAREMNTEDRQSMINDMVARLAERLETDGGSADEWIRLMNAYMVLGKKDEARQAAAKAIAAHGGDAAARARIEQAAGGLGIPL
ncbi:cytochrome c-type biogenesis protein CcmH [Rhodobium orientis]|uniref:C-type cytochrome biogenesis protein CcmI n=1 Tax=Rhodobium orientis TaxID=34017 RepID=A0A327JEU1_9HYPH|nr:c-type cytochrome biogenesis protein CcmI [Rhodobium orientis]MBB4305052.1 cytochrome c-type biogenesis protein CcmH [Rhodobium orientis]MBK5949896.1 c-type cytochrome biogenesis protein CcmI [Rhodobium orientis]RAI24849.1 c-type cytochrome biogenesis protein CcmI [Rhodobium orientis]